jgi:inosine kinase
MKFPGRRIHKHFFPVSKKAQPISPPVADAKRPYIVGLDQTIVDIEARVDAKILEQFGFTEGLSQLVDADIAEELYQYLVQHNLILDQHAGGTIGNTLHNYSVLSDDRSVLYGVMSNNIEVGNYAYRYLCNTSSKVDLQHLQPVDGAIGRAFTLISDSGERTFAIDAGKMNYLSPDFISEELIKNSQAFVLSAYFVRCKGDETLDKASLKAIEYANKHEVPVVLSLGTRFVIEEQPQWWRDFIKKHVQVIAMNEEEAKALVGTSEPLAACEKALDLVDLVLCTAGPEGLYMAGFIDDKFK